MTKKYCVHPGEVLSKNDGDMHYVDVTTLVRLYNLKRDEYVIFRGPGSHIRNGNLLCLHPRYDGRYDVKVVAEESNDL